METESSQEYLKELGERLQGIRQLKGLTQKQVAADTGISQSFLSSLERGRKNACTAQIIRLIRYYRVPYEMVFGSSTGSYTLHDFPSEKNKDICIELLNMLVGRSKCEDLIKGSGNCIKLVVYIVFRTIYRENPRNSAKLFSIDYDDALEAAKYILESSPMNIAKFIRDSRINAGCFELPPERNAELRSFLSECELILKSVKYNTADDTSADFKNIITQK